MQPTSSVDLLRAAIKRSGLSNSAYAREVLVRDPRTIRRWLSGESIIPNHVAAFLEAQESADRREGERRTSERRSA